MSKKRERKNPEKRREEIITAARRLFANQGYEKTTMKQVVEEAGTSIGNCYFYFSNKMDLYQGVVDAVNQEISGLVVAAIVQMESPHEKLAAAVYFGVMAVLKLADSAALILTGTDHPEIRHIILDHYTKRVYRFLKRNPVVTGKMDLDMIAVAWQGAMFNLIERHVKEESQKDAREVARFLVGWNLRALNTSENAITEARRNVERKYDVLYG